MPDAQVGLTALGIATAAQTGYAGGTFGGVSVSATDVLVMYTYKGDANLDGFISGDDHSAIDFNLVAQGAPFPTGEGASAVVAVPEPAWVSAALAASLLLRRRRS